MNIFEALQLLTPAQRFRDHLGPLGVSPTSLGGYSHLVADRMMSEALLARLLAGMKFERHDPTACVVLVSCGYPGAFEPGMPIPGIADAESTGATVFHAGTMLGCPDAASTVSL
jgi:hypothetical protein